MVNWSPLPVTVKKRSPWVQVVGHAGLLFIFYMFLPVIGALLWLLSLKAHFFTFKCWSYCCIVMQNAYKANTCFFFLSSVVFLLLCWVILFFSDSACFWSFRKLSDGQWWKAAEEVLWVRAAVFCAAHERLTAAFRSWILWRDSAWRAGLQPHGRPPRWLWLSLHHGLQNGEPVRMWFINLPIQSLLFFLHNW